MLSITGPYEAPFDPRQRPPTWMIPLGQVREASLVALCKGLPTPAAMVGRRACRAVRRAPDGAGLVDPVAMASCGSADCLPCVVEAGEPG